MKIVMKIIRLLSPGKVPDETIVAHNVPFNKQLAFKLGSDRANKRLAEVLEKRRSASLQG